MEKSSQVRKPLLVALIAVLCVVVFTGLVALAAKGAQDDLATAPPQPTPSPTFDPADMFQSKPPKPAVLARGAPCTPLHFGFDGAPRHWRFTKLGVYQVPEGREWRFTNVSLLAERHHGGPNAIGGEWTSIIHGLHNGKWRGNVHHNGKLFTIAQTSLDNSQGIALQQHRVAVTLDERDHLIFAVWLLPGTHPPNYYYDLALSGMDCPE